MARPKRSSPTLQKAEKRQAGLQSISATLDLGNGLTLQSYSSLITTLRIQLTTYNTALSTLDEQARQIQRTEQQLRDLSEQMVLGVAAKYGKDSSEYGQAGGVPKSERRRSTRKSSTVSNRTTLRSLLTPAPTPTATADPINGNGNGKVLVP